jgi:hypothetical protein
MPDVIGQAIANIINKNRADVIVKSKFLCDELQGISRRVLKTKLRRRIEVTLHRFNSHEFSLYVAVNKIKEVIA